MRILLLTFAYLPRSIGGTEIYVSGLARQLQASGDEVRVAVAATGAGTAEVVEGVPVQVIAADAFDEALQEWRPDVVHCHPLTATGMVPWMRIAKARAVPVVCTYHTPTLTCGRGDLLHMGREVCDGFLEVHRCARCVLHSKGVPAPLCEIVRVLSPVEGPTPAWLPRRIRSMLAIAGQRERAVSDWMEVRGCVDQWVATARWAADVLQINGVSRARITLSRQGLVGTAPAGAAAREIPKVRGRLVVGFLGRIDPRKGVETLLDAAGRLATSNLEIRIAGGGPPDYVKALQRRCSGDDRIHWLGRLVPGQTVRFLGDLDVLVVPSIWMESGPMTVLEAWSAGTPVIGSLRGGIAEWFDEYGGGLGFPPGDPGALAALLREVAQGERALPPVPARVRSMADVGDDMRSLYRRVACA